MSAIIVAGDEGVGKSALIQSVIQGLAGAAEDRSQSLSPDGIDEAVPTAKSQVAVEQAGAIFDSHDITIATKYYSAKVALWEQLQPLSIMALRSFEPADMALEGIIVLFDMNEDSSLDVAMEWEAYVDDNEACTFRVCVGSKIDRVVLTVEEKDESTEERGRHRHGDGCTMNMSIENRRRRCMEWCLDHGFEYIEADCRDFRTGGELREKEGIPRLIEALQSNVWASMEYTTANRPSLMLGGSLPATPAALNDVTPLGDTVEATEDSNIDTTDHSDGGGDSPPGREDCNQHTVSEHLEGFVEDGARDVRDAAIEPYASDGENSQADAHERIMAAGYGALDGDDDDESDDGGEHTCHDRDEEDGRPAVSWKMESESRPKEEGIQQGAEDRSSIGRDHVQLQALWEGDHGSIPSQANASEGKLRCEADQREGDVVKGSHVGEPSSIEQNGDGQYVRWGSMIGSEAMTSRPTNKEGGARVLEDRAEVADRQTSAGGQERHRLIQSDSHDRSRARSTFVGIKDAAAPLSAEACKDDREQQSVDAATSNPAGNIFRELVGDAGYDEMESLIADVRAAREQGNNLPDLERRERAANLAMRLATMLGDEDSDSSGRENGDEANSS